MTTSLDVAGATGKPVNKVGGAFMTDRSFATRGSELGVGGWPFYYVGRGGVLGDVDPDVVTAAFVFLPPSMVRKGWTRGRAVLSPESAVTAFLAACHAWGREHLAGCDGLPELIALGRRVMDDADVAGLPLFAGWRAVPLPEDPAAAAAQVLHVLREHRGGVHGIAVRATGLTPLQAVLAGRYGEEHARFFNWPQPWPDVSSLEETWAAAEALTNRLAAPAYEGLSEMERARFVELVQALPRV